MSNKNLSQLIFDAIFTKYGQQINNDTLSEDFIYDLKSQEEEIMINFALFHSTRMKYALQSDNKFYAKQSFELWFKGENKESEEQKTEWIKARDYMTNIIYKAESDNLHLKTEYQIKDRIIGIQSEIHELLKERDEYMNKYGGLTKEKDADIKSDIAFKSHEIRILGWVLGIVKITQI